MSHQLAVEPLAAACGARIGPVDLTRLSDGEFAQMRAVLADRGVIFIEDQDLSPEQHIDFAKRWGEIDVNRYF
ncbi:MAG: TauD/TfdA family dioxygenase, partial [Caulobacteraceae bacterium]|nr:TauD/TfdA family dioxygenase [Caulobacteraceae bacterium]